MSMIVSLGKNRTLLGAVGYVAVLGAGVWIAVASLGIVGNSMAKLVPPAPEVTGEPGYTWVPLPPVIHPPATPKRDPTVRRANIESSFVTLSGAAPKGLDALSSNAQSDSFVTLGTGATTTENDTPRTELLPELFGSPPLAAPAPLTSP